MASDFGRAVRDFVSDPLHTAIFPGPLTTIASDNAAAHRFSLAGGGALYAVGVGGPLTGRGSDVLLIDDPIQNMRAAYSVAERKTLQTWFEGTAYTRLAPNGKIILIMTRWHMDDLVGWAFCASTRMRVGGC